MAKSTGLIRLQILTYSAPRALVRKRRAQSHRGPGLVVRYGPSGVYCLGAPSALPPAAEWLGAGRIRGTLGGRATSRAYMDE